MADDPRGDGDSELNALPSVGLWEGPVDFVADMRAAADRLRRGYITEDDAAIEAGFMRVEKGTGAIPLGGCCARRRMADQMADQEG